MNSKLLTQFPSNLLPDDYSSRPRHKAFLFVAFKDLALRRRPLFKKKKHLKSPSLCNINAGMSLCSDDSSGSQLSSGREPATFAFPIP